jgi:hypothetical protein
MNDLKISRGENGYLLEHDDEYDDGEPRKAFDVIQDDELDDLASGERLLYWVMSHFDFGGSKFDKKRLAIKRVRGDHYEPPSKQDEKA